MWKDDWIFVEFIVCDELRRWDWLLAEADGGSGGGKYCCCGARADVGGDGRARDEICSLVTVTVVVTVGILVKLIAWDGIFEKSSSNINWAAEPARDGFDDGGGGTTTVVWLKLINEVEGAIIPRGRSRGLTAVPSGNDSSMTFVDVDFTFDKAAARWWRDSVSVKGIETVLKSGFLDWHRLGIGHSVPSNLYVR